MPMLRMFFFVLSLLTDYRAVSDAIHAGAIQGVINTGVLLGALLCVYIRRMTSHAIEHAADSETARENLVPSQPSSRSQGHRASQDCTA